jgi:hypothetical protein
MKEGYLYIATGENYINEAKTSVKSLRTHSPNAHVSLITDKKIIATEFDEIQILENDVENYFDWKAALIFKVEALLHSPYEKTFFVDTDTYFLDDCSELFQLLNFFDILIAHAPADSSQVVIDDHKINGYYPYNTGVIVFNRNQLVLKLFTDWLNIYKNKYHLYPTDQTAFMESLLINKVCLYVLQSIYNFRVPFFVSILPDLKVKIIHGRYPNFKLLDEKINSHLLQRCWNPEKGEILCKKSL